jgi:AraC-like DNA-binding protein
MLLFFKRGDLSMEYIETIMNKPLAIASIISIHYFEYAKDFTFSGEFHDFWELVYADKEELIITAGAHELFLPTGHLYIHRPLEFHNLRCNGEKAANSVIISFSCPSSQLYSIAGKILSCPSGLKKNLATIIDEAKDAFSTPLGERHTLQLIPNKIQPFGAEQLIQNQLECFLIRLIRAYGESSQKKETDATIELNGRLAEICRYLEENVENKLSFINLCQRFSMSESALKKLFRDGIGCGAMDFYNRCKIDRAKQLIREKEINFTEIADRLGYNTVQYFSLRFKQSTGMTPSQYSKSIENML